MLVDPYHDRYFKDGKVVGVRYDGPVGGQQRSEYDLGLGILTPPGSTEQGKIDILTPPGSTEMGQLEPITPPSTSVGGFDRALEDMFLMNFIQDMQTKPRKLGRHGRPK